MFSKSLYPMAMSLLLAAAHSVSAVVPARPAPRRRIAPRRLVASTKVNSAFDPNINRHTGRPHEHAREIARRARQAAGAA